MSHLALRPESFATNSYLLRGSLRYMQAAASAALLDFCPSSRSSDSFDKGQPAPANTPHLLRWCPLTQSPNPFSRHPCIGGGSSRGEGCQPPYFSRSSVLTYKAFLIQGDSESSHPTQYIFEGDSLSLFLFSSYIIPKRASNVKAIMATTKELFLLLQPSLLALGALL
jgi:hypothetical protein